MKFQQKNQEEIAEMIKKEGNLRLIDEVYESPLESQK